MVRRGLPRGGKAIQQADSVPADAQPFDFFASGDEYDAMGAYLHRVSMAYGYAANPIEGVSVVEFWKLLKDFRTMVREAPSADQAKMFELLIASSMKDWKKLVPISFSSSMRPNQQGGSCRVIYPPPPLLVGSCIG
jgi:hypothetical protein